MSRRKHKKQRKRRSKRSFDWFRRPGVDLERAFTQADHLIDQDRVQEAIVLLDPLLASHPREAELHYYLGYAQVKAGDLWGGLAGYERAMELSRNPDYWLPLSSLYLELGLNAHALHAFRQMLKSDPDGPMADQARHMVTSLEQDVMATADQLHLPITKMEKGLRLLEEGMQALNRGDYSGCITANRRAIKLLDDWPPPHNNLSQALFFDGQPEAALKVSRTVLARDPENLQALSNAIRFLSWTGQETEAQAFWSQLRKITPQGNTERLKQAEAAAILGEDESVYQLFKPLDESGAALSEAPGSPRQIQLFLAVAEANLGKRPAAQRRLKALLKDVPRAGEFLVALKAKQSGPGWAERFPYFHSTELIPRPRMEELVTLAERQNQMPVKRFRNQVGSFVARFPQIILIGEKLIWEENQLQAGVGILEMVETPTAYAVLRRFGLSQIGDDEIRLQALFRLVEAGKISQDETLRVWSKGEWQEVQLRQYEIVDEPEVFYAPEVADLLNRGLRAFKRNNEKKAVQLFQQALTVEPRAKEAYNNLGTIYSRRQEHKRAKEMFQKAVEIDPNYVFPRGNLAIYLLDEDNVEDAKAMLAPLAQVTRLQPQEMAFYSYIQARILVYEEVYDEARKMLDVALEVWPAYEPAESLKEHLEQVTPLLTGWQTFMERQRKQDQTRRVRLQAKLTTAEPNLAEALALYSKDVLTGIARVVLPHGGWSALRKAELLQKIVEALQDRDNLGRILGSLNDDDHTALHQVLEAGGSMPWHDFEAHYGSDLEESPYWNRHVPETLMGRLRLRGLLVEAKVNRDLVIAVPSELRGMLPELLSQNEND